MLCELVDAVSLSEVICPDQRELSSSCWPLVSLFFTAGKEIKLQLLPIRRRILGRIKDALQQGRDGCSTGPPRDPS